MFSSVSSCVPNSTVTTSFTSGQDQLLDITANVILKLNGVLVNTRPVAVLTNDIVTAEITTSNVHLGYKSFQYTVNNSENYFAVVNKNNYTPTVRQDEVGKRWFNYNLDQFLISFYGDINQIQRPLGFGKRQVDIDTTHIALDHINNAVCFYSTSRELITSVLLPSGPITYKKSTYYDSVLGQNSTEAMILCSDKRIYRIRFDNRYYSGDEYSPTVIPVFLAENLWFEQDLPSGQSFIESRRAELLLKTRPPTTALDIGQNYIWIGGYDAIYLLTKQFQQIRKIDLPDEKIIDIAHINNDAFALGRDGKLFYVSSATGSVSLVYQKTALGSPCSLNNKVIVPDPNSQRLLVFSNNSGSFTTLSTSDFAPAYAFVFDNTLWVTGHDTNVVLRYNQNLTDYQKYYFDSKVSLVSVVADSILALHYLKDFVTLELTGIKKVIPFELARKRGPLSHVGTDPIKLTMLGQENILPVSGPGITAWTNGIADESLKTGDFLGVSYRGQYNGKFRSYVILGENAFDYDVEILSSTKVKDYFSPNAVALDRLSGLTVTYIPPDVGDDDEGLTGPIPLGFDFNMNGRIYNELYVTTNGLIVFDPNTTYSPGIFGSKNGNTVLYVEPGDLYQGGAINNVNPLNIYQKLDSGQTPGIYYNSDQLAEFNYFRIRWVGTTANTQLFGVNKSTTTSMSNWNQIPLDSVANISANMYVSGGNITSSTRVISTYSYERSLDVLYSNISSNYFTVDNPTYFDYRKYSTITNTNTGISNYIITTANISLSRKLFTFTSNSIVVADMYSYNVDQEHVVTLPLINNQSARRYDVINSIRQTQTITCANVVDANTFTVSSIDYEKIYNDQIINNWVVSSKFVSNSEYIINTTSNHGLSPGDVITSNSTVINFSTDINYPILEGGTAYIEKYVIYTGNVASLMSGNVNLVAYGNFAEINANRTINANSQLLFAPDYAAPAKTYEVGFYIGKNYQYLEYFYDSANHQANTTIGLISDTLSINTACPTNSSIVFSSDVKSGNWQELGIGSFNKNGNRYLPRGIKYVKSIVQNQNQDRVEIYFDREIKSESNVLVSTDYGYLSVNNANYTGNSYITGDSIISLTAPMNDSLRTIAPMLSIGDYQVAIPMTSRSATSSQQQITYLYDNQTPNAIVSANVNITVTGTYYIPAYYRYSNDFSDIDIKFQRLRGSTITDIASKYAELLAGDKIVITRQLTPSGLYNYSDIDIVGPVNIKVRWQTSSGNKFNYISFDSLDNPYTRQYSRWEANENGYITYIDDDYVRTSNIAITSNVAITGNLYIDAPAANLVVNGVTYGNYVSNVATGANIALQRKVLNYFQGNIDLYQVKYDSVTATNVYIPVGIWTINNRSITSSDQDISFTSETIKSIEFDTINDNNSTTVSTLMDSLVDSKKYFTFSLEEIINSINQISYATNSEYINPVYTILTNEPFDANKLVQQPLTVLSMSSEVEDVSSIFKFNLDNTYYSAKSVLTNSLTEEAELIKSQMLLDTDKYIENVATNFSFLMQENGEISTTLLDAINSGDQEKITNYITGKADQEIQKNSATLYANLTLDNVSNNTVITDIIPPDFNSVTSTLYGRIISDNKKENSILTSILDAELKLGKILLEDKITNQLEKIKQNMKSTNQTVLEKDKSNLFDSLSSQIITDAQQLRISQISPLIDYVNQELTSSISTKVEGLKTFFISTLDQEAISNKNFLFDSLISQLDRTKNILSSEIDQQLSDLSNILKSNIQVDSNYITSLITGKLDSELDQAKSLFKSNLELVNNTATNILSATPIYQLDDNFTTLNSLLNADLDNVSISLRQIIQNITEYANTVLSKTLEKIIDSSSTIISNNPEFDKLDTSYIFNKFDIITDGLNYIQTSISPVQHELNYIQFVSDVVKDDRNYIFKIPVFIQEYISYYKIIIQPNFYVRSYVSIDMEYQIDRDIPWMSDDISVHGAIRSNVSIWANNGRAGDKITNMGNPPDMGPFVLYNKEYNYMTGGYKDYPDAAAIAAKYVSANVIQIVGTDFWNYRIYFNNRHYCVPKKGSVFPIRWYMRGG